MSTPVTLHRGGDIAVVTIDNPPVNALSPAVIDGLRTNLDAALKDPAVRGVVLAGAGRTFCGGADIKEFGKITAGKSSAGDFFNPLLNALEESAKPVVAAIQGTCFGGGLEVVMACHYRLAGSAAQVGQPEVKIGLIPGAGGTQRLPRLAGVAKAAEMCAGGNPVGAADALKFGIVDRIVDGDLLQEAVRFTRELADKGSPPRRTRDLKDKLGTPESNAPILAFVHDQVRKRAPHLLAPMKAVEAVEAAARMPFAEGLKFEAKLFQECLFSDQSKALIHLFFAEREVGKVPGLPKDVPPLPIRTAAVIGAGTMGGGIAMVYANAGIPVLLREVNQEALDRGVQTITKNYAASVQKGRLTRAEMDRRLGLIRPTLSYDDFGSADIVVEAVFEDLALKKKVFAELDKVARPDAVLATNTSTLDVDAIASVTSRPQQVIGHHFFSPANVMKLLEVVRGAKSSPAVIAASLALAKTLSKVGVLAGNRWGFIGNRLFFPYLRESQLLVEEGATVEAVDAALTTFGMAMGPFAVDDLAGIDVGWRVRKEYPQLTPPGQRAPLVADKLYELGRYGQKTGAGWYRYEGGRTPVADPAVAKLIEETARAAGIQRRTVPAEELVERPLYALINEGAKVLEEGVALRAGDIDVIYGYGYGFPPHRGGPMWYADTVGLKAVYERVRQFEREHGALWQPAGLLQRLAEAGKTFADYDRERAG
jgi:3-hydroxyacyl-CoA dehydrogenase